MTAEELINPLIPALMPTDPVGRARAWMDEFSLRQLALIEERRFVGMVADSALLESLPPDETLTSLPRGGQQACVRYDQHFYEVIRVAIDHGMHAVAVLDAEGCYAGLITLNDTITAFARSYAVQTRGGILVLLLEEHDYSLAEISRLVESNNVKVVSAFLSEDQTSPRLRLTLKLNQNDVTRVAATLDRFGYTIVAQFDEAQTQETEKERLDILLRYLNI